MDPTSEPLAAEVIKHLMNSLWQGVAESIIEKNLALKSAHLEIAQFIGSYISNSTQNREIGRVQMVCEKDPSSIDIDNLAYGQLPKQTRENNNISAGKSSVNGSFNQTRSRRFTIQSFHKQKSSPAAKDDSQGLLTLPQAEDLHYVKDPLEDNCRNKMFQSEKQQSDMRKMVLERQKERQESGVKNAKLLKDLKKYTYDFDGKFFSVGQMQSQQQKISKIEKQNGQQSIVKRETKSPESKNINNQKIKERETRNNREFGKQDKNVPQFNENRPQSLLDMFEEDNKLSEGIKLIGEKGSEKIVKQKPRRKLSGMRKYRLEEFQNMVREKKFKKLASQHTATIDANKTAPLNQYNPETKPKQNLMQKPSINSSSEISLVIKKQQTTSILPPIQSIHMMKKGNKIGTRRLSVGYQESSRSLLNESGVESRRSKKSQIKIDHEELYLQNFTLSSYGK